MGAQGPGMRPRPAVRAASCGRTRPRAEPHGPTRADSLTYLAQSATVTTAPLAFSGSRLHWSDLPREVRARIAELAGADVVSETSATNGFTPGYAALLGLGDGTQVFVKAVSPEQNPESPDLARREIAVAGQLPPEVNAPRLWWHHDDGTWVILGLQPVDGRAPEQPWRPDELTRALDALRDLAEVGTPAPPGLRPLTEEMTLIAGGWARLEAVGADVDAAVEAVGEHGAWLRENLPRMLELASGGIEAGAGRTLVHGDFRADNVMLSTPPDTRAWIIDWVHACRDGAPWWDLLAALPSIAMQGGGDPEDIFWARPNAADADRDAVRAVLAGITGNLVQAAVQPPPPGLPNVRAFQLAQAVAALEWLRRV